MTYAAIEAGGTKFVCAIGNAEGEILDSTTIKTTTPEETMAQVVDYFKAQQKKHSFIAMGIGSFGPIDANPKSANFGSITSTPKLAWCNFNLVKHLKPIFNVPRSE